MTTHHIPYFGSPAKPTIDMTTSVDLQSSVNSPTILSLPSSPLPKLATIDALSDSILPNFCFKLTIIGMEPRISITAKSTIDAVRVSFHEKYSNIGIY